MQRLAAAGGEPVDVDALVRLSALADRAAKRLALDNKRHEPAAPLRDTPSLASLRTGSSRRRITATPTPSRLGGTACGIADAIAERPRAILPYSRSAIFPRFPLAAAT